VYVYVYAYVYVRVHIHTRTKRARRSFRSRKRSSVSSSLLGSVVATCLLGARARARYRRALRDGLQEMFTIETSDDSGSKLRDKEQQRLSSK